MKRIFWLVAAVVGVMVGMAFVMPAVAKISRVGGVPGLDAVLLLLGVGLVALGIAAGVLGLRSQRN